MKKHKDRRSLVSGVIRVNDEFEGCRFRFPDLDFDAGVVPLGHILMFPKYYDHEVTELTAKKRCLLAIWISGEPLPEASTAVAAGGHTGRPRDASRLNRLLYYEAGGLRLRPHGWQN